MRKRFSCLDGLTLKCTAMALMLCDHLWATVIPGNLWLTCLGRLAFPIFAFQVAEGFANTRSFRRYFGRMLLFALLSEIPFDLMYGGSLFYPFHQNVLFTFCLALLLLRLLERVRSRGTATYLLAAAGLGFLGYWLGMLLMVDYYGYGVLTVLLFFLCRDIPLGWLGQAVGLAVINVGMMGGLLFSVSLFGRTVELPQQGLAVLALLPIWLYNGQRGRDSRLIRLACYGFYPLHILALVLIVRLL